MEFFGPGGGLLIKSHQSICDFIKKDKIVYPDLVKVSNLPTNQPCPFPKANYTINNYIFDDSKFGPVPPGKYTGKARLVDEEGNVLTHVEFVAVLRI